MGIEEPPGVPLRRRRNRGRTVLFMVLGLFLVAALVSVGFMAHLGRSSDTQAVKIPTAFPAETLRPENPVQGPAARTSS